MRLIPLFAIPLLATALSAGTGLANPANSDTQIDGTIMAEHANAPEYWATSSGDGHVDGLSLHYQKKVCHCRSATIRRLSASARNSCRTPSRSNLPVSMRRLAPFLEYSHFDDDGDAQTEWRYLTFGVAGDHGPWNLSLTYSGRDAEANDPDEPVDKPRLRQLLLHYTFQDGATVNLSHQRDGDGIDVIESMSFRMAFPL